MHNTTFVHILKSLDKTELKSLEDFISSPYFNKKTGVIKLFSYVKRFYPDFTNKKLNREIAWNFLYPVKKYNYGIFKNLVFDASKLCEIFLTIEYFRKDETEYKYDFLDVLYEKKLSKLFNAKYELTEKQLKTNYKKKNIPSEIYFHTLSKLNLLKFGFSSVFVRYKNIDTELNNSINFRLFEFFILLIKDYNNLISFSKDYKNRNSFNILSDFLSKASDAGMLEDVLNCAKSESKEIFELLDTYYKFYKTYSDSNSMDKYFEFKKALKEKTTVFPKQDLYILYSGLQNSLGNLTDPGINTSREVIEIVKLRIRDNVLINQEGIIETTYFISVIQTACNLNETTFIENFTSSFSKYLSADIRENLLLFSESHLLFTKGEFNKSLELTLLINYENTIMKFYIKNLQLMIYFELEDFDSYLLASDSFRHFLSGNKSITNNWKYKLKLFDNFLNRIFKIRIKNDFSELNKLKREILNSDTSKKLWLLKKIEMLIGNPSIKMNIKLNL